MNIVNVDFICFISFIILFIISILINVKNSKVNSEFNKHVEQIEDEKLKLSVNVKFRQIIRYQGLLGLIGLFMGLVIGVGFFNQDFERQGVKEYLRGNITVKYQNTYEDSTLVKCDTIIKLK